MGGIVTTLGADGSIPGQAISVKLTFHHLFLGHD